MINQRTVPSICIMLPLARRLDRNLLQSISLERTLSCMSLNRFALLGSGEYIHLGVSDWLGFHEDPESRGRRSMPNFKGNVH